MLSVLRLLYNEGENNGNVNVKTHDKNLLCHDFVLKSTSDFFRDSMNGKPLPIYFELDYNSKLVNIVLNCMYSEKVVDEDLTGQDIIKLYALINQLKCRGIDMIIKNHYIKKFPSTLTENNWMMLLRMVFNIEKYNDLQKEILNYFAENILMNLETVNMCLFSDLYKDTDGNIKDALFKICLEKILSLTTELKNLEDDSKNKLNDYLKEEYDEEEEEISEEEPKKPLPKKKK